MQIKILTEGGNMKPGPALSQKLGPAGINVNQVIERINNATKDFKGLKVPVELEVNPSTKDFEVKVFSPPVSELLKRELVVEKGSGIQKKKYIGNLSIEQIISVAQTKFPNLLCNDMKSAVKTVIGTCVSLGILVENQLASELASQIDEGKFSKEIKEERTITPPEKMVGLKEYFETIRNEQEKVLKIEQAAKESEAQKQEEAAKEEKPAEEKKEPAKKELAKKEPAKK